MADDPRSANTRPSIPQHAVDQGQVEGKKEFVESRLRALDVQYRFLVQNSSDIIFILSPWGRLTFINDTVRILGFEPGELVGRHFESLVSKEDNKKIEILLAEEEPPEDVTQVRFRYHPKHAEEIDQDFLEVELKVIRIRDHEEEGILGLAREIALRAETDDALRMESERFEAILDGNPIPVFVIDKNHRTVLWNKACEMFTGVPKDQVLGRPIDSRLFYSGKERPVLSELVLDMDETAMAALFGRNGLKHSTYVPEAFEVRERLVIGGSTRDAYIHAARIRDREGHVLGAIETIQDITERENLQRQLQHIHKMEAVGTLAGGMAHEFNNILASIQGYIQLMRMAVGEDHSLSGHLEESEISCRRAANLTHKMLTFARLNETKKVPVKLNQIVESTHRLLKQTLPPPIEFSMELQNGLPFVLAEPTELEQVILNLGLNARDAMPKGGLIRFRTALAKIDDAFCRRCPWARPGQYLSLIVEDSGCGMPANVLEHVFDPFFSTKEPGKGTGLGLSIVYSIVKNHGGYILADSEEGKGSRFTVYLPIADEDFTIQEASPDSNMSEVPIGRGERVLVVEDEAQLRDIVKDYLECHGYVPIPAANGQEAVTIYCESLKSKMPIPLVVLDLAMPVMDGEACMQALLEVDPNVNLLVATGYDIEQSELHTLSGNVAGFICKPFDFHDLLRRVREILDRRG